MHARSQDVTVRTRTFICPQKYVDARKYTRKHAHAHIEGGKQGRTERERRLVHACPQIYTRIFAPSLYSYGPIKLWPAIVMARYSYGPI